MNSWKDIWSNRQPGRCYDLADLIKLNGFDSNGTAFNAHNWIEYVESFKAMIPIKPYDSVFEFGCGCGAFLKPLYDNGHDVGGVDYSEVLISVAKVSMANAELQLQNVDKPCGAKPYDIVMSHSVFQYFESLEYASLVSRNMLAKSSKKVAILDIPNKQLQEASERARSNVPVDHGSRKSQNNVQHLYYEKRWFEQISKD